MEKIVREFKVIVEYGETITHYNFRAVIKWSYRSCYRIKVVSSQYEKERLKSFCESEFYYDDVNEMIKDFEYHFELNKGNVFTTSIKIIK